MEHIGATHAGIEERFKTLLSTLRALEQAFKDLHQLQQYHTTHTPAEQFTPATEAPLWESIHQAHMGNRANPREPPPPPTEDSQVPGLQARLKELNKRF